jgi:peptide-methionine (S)-S-oxide reductase
MALPNRLVRRGGLTMFRILIRSFACLSGLLALGALAACSPTDVKAGATAKIPNPAVDDPLAATKGEQTAVFAGGCFWGIQAVFEHVKGVISATAGYSGGSVKNPSYETVSSGETGHAESVKVVYDPSQISYGQLLKVFFSVAHDPTELNRQGPDTGTQYRSAIFYANENQRRIARVYIEQLNQAKVFPRPIVTQVVAFIGFYPAEDYHQDYARKHPYDPYIMINDLPKVEHLRQELPELCRTK